MQKTVTVSKGIKYWTSYPIRVIHLFSAVANSVNISTDTFFFFFFIYNKIVWRKRETLTYQVHVIMFLCGAALPCQQRAEMKKLQAKLSEDAALYGRQLCKKEAESEIMFDDLDRLNDQYQQLNREFENQASKLAKTHVRERV